MMRIRQGVLVVSALVCLTTAGVVARQQFVLSSQDRAKLISVDFAVMGPDGAPIGDLRADEVTLRIDGRARPVRALEYVAVRTIAASAALPYGSNLTSDEGRAVVLLVDLETIRAGREATLREHVGQLVRTLAPSDRLALVTIPYGGVKVDLTSDHDRVVRTLASLTGQAAIGESESEGACRTRTTLASMRGVLDDLRGGEAPVAVVLFSGQMSAPQGVVAMASGTVIGRCQLLREHFQQVGAAAAGARAQLYLIHPELSVSSGGLAGLEHLTGVTGAPLWHLGDPASSGLARVTKETGGYYLARIEPDPAEANGSIHGLSVSVSRQGVTVRARPQMAVARTQARFANATPVAPLAMMKDARVYRDLPLRVAGFASREAGSDAVRVVVMFESPDPAAALSDAIVGLYSSDGRLVANRVLTSAEVQGRMVVTALTAPAGTYRLRVAASEASGRGGTADFPLDAGLVRAGTLRLSDLVLGLSRDGQFQPRLEFESQASMMAQLEVYGGREGERVGVVVEIARTVNGPALLAMPGAFAATNEADKFLVTAAIPIGALPPGDYVVRATVAAQDQAGGRVVRPIRKVVR